MNGEQYKIDFPPHDRPEPKNIDWEKRSADKENSLAVSAPKAPEKNPAELEAGRQADLEKVRETIEAAKANKDHTTENDDLFEGNDNSNEYKRYRDIKNSEERRKAVIKKSRSKGLGKAWYKYLSR